MEPATPGEKVSDGIAGRDVWEWAAVTAGEKNTILQETELC